MPSYKGTGNLKDELNRMNPASGHAKLGDLLDEIITKHNAVLSKLDAIGAAGASSSAIATAAGTTNVATLSITALNSRT